MKTSNFVKIIFFSTLLASSFSLHASGYYQVKPKTKQMTVTVKEHLGMTESGDGYAFTTKDGKTFFVYNAGGEYSIKGESYIDDNATICLKFNKDGDISSVQKGKCN